MKAIDFDFSNTLKQPQAGDRVEQAANDALVVDLAVMNDGDRYLRIVERTSRIARHRELYELLRSEAIQYFIPHQIFISAWGNFDGLDLQRDVISALPGLRTSMLRRCTMNGMLRVFYKRWLVQGRQPMLLKSPRHAQLEYSGCDCALHKFLQSRWSMLVHGVTNARDGEVSLYLALHTDPIVKGSVERFCQLVDPLVSQIDAAFRRVAVLKSLALPGHNGASAGFVNLSSREAQILSVVAEGKSNVEVSKVLGISAFTVKSHMRRILQKLQARNRTEAVARFRDMRRPDKKI